MLLWFVGTAVLSVWFVFRDPLFDYRLLCVGALLPDLIDIWFGGARVLHSVVASVGSLLLVVAASAGRKPWRKRALALPIGMMMHLIYDGAFANSKLFWWPIGGASFDQTALPSVARGWLNVPLEMLGVVAVVWIWRTFGLGSRPQRDAFWHTGQLQPQRAVDGHR